jgi:hypothetical protein
MAPYCLKLEDRKDVLKWLKTLKFLNHYAVNIKQSVNINTSKLNVVQRQNYHIIIETNVSNVLWLFECRFVKDLV